MGLDENKDRLIGDPCEERTVYTELELAEQEFDALKAWIRQISPVSIESPVIYELLGGVSSIPSEEIGYKLLITMFLQKAELVDHPLVSIYVGQFLEENSPYKQPILSWELKRFSHREAGLKSTLQSNLESFGVTGLEFREERNCLIMSHSDTGKQLRFVQRSRPDSIFAGGNVYFEDIPQAEEEV